jgi:hypothetical protein
MASRQERKLSGSGVRWIAIGAPLVVIGIVLALVLHGDKIGIGAAIAVFGAIPVVVGVVLLLTAGTEQHARKDRPLA